MRRIAEIGEKLTILSVFLLALSIPISIAVDNIAAGLGLLGIVFLVLGGKISPYPPVKPLVFLLIPQFISSILFFPAKIFETDFKLHLVPYFSVFRTVKENPEYFMKLVYVLSFSVVLLDISILFEAFTWQNVKHINFANLSLHLHPVRARGFLNHPLTTAGVVFLILVFLFATYLQFRKRIVIIPIILSTIALVFTESRSYWVGFFVFVVFLIIFTRDRRVIAGALSILVSFLFLFQIPQIKHRFESIFNTRTNFSNIDRLALWKANILAYIKDYSVKEKIFGAGYKADDLAWREFKSSFYSFYRGKELPEKQLRYHFHNGLTHNIYLKYLTKYGIFGLIGFISFWVFVFYYNFSRRREGLVLFVKTLTAGYLGFLAAGIFENNFTDAEVQYTTMFILGVNFAVLHKDVVDKLRQLLVEK